MLERNKCISGYSYKPSKQENDTERKIAGIARGKRSRHGLTADSELSFPLLFHLNKQGGWPDRARRGGAGWGGGGCVGGGWGGVRGSGERGGAPWLEYNQRERRRRRGGRGQAHHVTVKSLQAAVLGKAETSPHIDAAVSPQQQFWEMAAVCTVAAIYMGLIQPGLSLSSPATAAGWSDLSLLPLIPSSRFFFLMPSVKVYVAWMKNRKTEKKQWK